MPRRHHGLRRQPARRQLGKLGRRFLYPRGSALLRRAAPPHARQSRDVRSQSRRLVYLSSTHVHFKPPVSGSPNRTSPPLHGVSFAVIDSAEASDRTVRRPEEDAEYARQFDLLAEMAPPGSWLVTHRPVWGILEGKEGEFQVENATYEAATEGSLKADYGLVLSGHIHVAESIAFDGRVGPAAATDLRQRRHGARRHSDGKPDRRCSSAIPTVDRSRDTVGVRFHDPGAERRSWIAIQRDKDGNPLFECVFDFRSRAAGSLRLDLTRKSLRPDADARGRTRMVATQ